MLTKWELTIPALSSRRTAGEIFPGRAGAGPGIGRRTRRGGYHPPARYRGGERWREGAKKDRGSGPSVNVFSMVCLRKCESIVEKL